MSTKQKEIADLVTKAARASAYVWSPDGKRELGEESCSSLRAMITAGAVITIVAALFDAFGSQKQKARTIPTISPIVTARPVLRSIPMPPQTGRLSAAGSTWEAPEVRRARATLGVGPNATLGEIHLAVAKKIEHHRALGGGPAGERSLTSAAVILGAVAVAGGRAA